MILDLTMIAVAFLCAYLGWRGGFVRTVISFFGFFISLIGGYLLAPHLAGALMPKVQSYFDGKDDSSFLGILGNSPMSASVLSHIIAFGILFLGLNILILIIKLIAKSVFSLPVLRQADKLCGLLLGLVLAYLFLIVASVLLFTFSELLIRAFDGISAEMFEGSVIARWFYENNIFKFLIKLGSDASAPV